MNKKGITLVEFIVSLALVSIVMIFLFNLLLDVQYVSKNGGFAKDNQMNRASILRSVMDDFNNLGLIGVREGTMLENRFELIFSFQKGSEKTFVVEEKKITYGDEVWSMKSSNSNAIYKTSCIPYEFIHSTCIEESCSNYFSFSFKIPVVINNYEENILDDLEFFYIGKQVDINEDQFPSGSRYLGSCLD